VIKRANFRPATQIYDILHHSNEIKHSSLPAHYVKVQSSRTIERSIMRRIIVILALGVIGVMIWGILVPHNEDTMHTSNAPTPAGTHVMHSTGAIADMELPAYFEMMTERTYVAYEYAVEHPEDLMYQPCYCGCNRMGHTNNLDCYLDGNDILTGTIKFDQHASVCGVCVDITHDVARLKAEGKTPMEIRRYIDANYAKVGPSTDTPYPPLS
jgi:hypothetical protein